MREGVWAVLSSIEGDLPGWSGDRMDADEVRDSTDRLIRRLEVEVSDPNQSAYDDLMGLGRLPDKGLRSRCSRCNAPSVTNQKGYQRCEQCWDDDATAAEVSS